MSEFRAVLEQARQSFPPPAFPVEAVVERGRRRKRNRRVGTAVMALVVSAAALVGLVEALRGIRPGPRPADLPTTPSAWSLSRIERPPTGQGAFARANSVFVVGDQLVAWGAENLEPEKNRGQASEPVAWSSEDGRRWSREALWPGAGDAEGRLTAVPVPGGPGLVTLLGQQVWVSSDGIAWERGPVDSDLSDESVRALIAAEQGLVAMDGGRAWFSSDGLDWESAAAPELPSDLLREDEYNDYFDGFGLEKLSMTAVAASPDRLVAVGSATLEWDLFTDEPLTRPVIWTSTDGRAWTETAVDPEVFPPAEAGSNPEGGLGVRIQDPGSRIDHIAWGPGGFVAIGSDGGEPILGGPAREAAIAVWVSPDGVEWERAPTDAFVSRYPNERKFASPVLFQVDAIAAGPAGYVAVGTDGGCRFGYEPPRPCPAVSEAVVWVSPDGRSWTRVRTGSVFAPARPSGSEGPPETMASSVVPWGSRFVVVGTHDRGAAVWISRPTVPRGTER